MPAPVSMTSITWTLWGTTPPPSPGGTSSWTRTTSTTSTWRNREGRRSSKADSVHRLLVLSAHWRGVEKKQNPALLCCESESDWELASVCLLCLNNHAISVTSCSLNKENINILILLFAFHQMKCEGGAPCHCGCEMLLFTAECFSTLALPPYAVEFFQLIPRLQQKPSNRGSMQMFL